MLIAPGDVREHLLATNPEYRFLSEEHSRYSTELERLTKELYLCSEDLILETKLKKLKLRVRDEMERMVALHERLHAATH
ncbi:MAG: hypothetical protein HY046_04220 [Acidobacteria bacterium]|nr:hypothetical protein [Acidobacteriota bacterium]